jgi:hypothetical protein
MEKKAWIGICALVAISLFAESGPVWTTPQEMPATVANAVYPVYDPILGKVVATWVDPTASYNGFSSIFDGTNWTTPIPIPTPVGTNNVALIPTTFDETLGKIVATWADEPMFSNTAHSSTFDGTSWSSPELIPGADSVIIVFPAYDSKIQKTVATWGNLSLNQLFSSTFDGTNWLPAPLAIPATNAVLAFGSDFSAINQFVTAWIDFTGNGFSSSFDGTAWSDPIPIATGMNFPNIVPLPNCGCNQALVTWSDGVTFQAFSSSFDGTSWSAPVPIPNSIVPINRAIFSAYDPVLEKVVAVWPEGADSTTAEGHFSLFDGTSWSEPQPIPGANSDGIVVAFDPALNKLLALWKDRTTGKGYSSLLYSPPITFQGSGNLASVANYINFVGGSAPMQPILTKLNRLNQAQLTEALASISNARNAFFPQVAGTTALELSQTMANRSAQLRWLSTSATSTTEEIANLTACTRVRKNTDTCPSFESYDKSPDLPYGSSQTAARGEKNRAIWVEGIGAFSHQNAQDQNPAFDANTGGALLGADYYGTRGQVLGSLAYGRSNITEEHSAGTGLIDSYAGSLYAMGWIRKGFIEVGCWGVYNRYKSDRLIQFPGFKAHAKASYSGWQVVPHFSAGYDFVVSNWVLEPFISADCSVITQDSFSEHGAAPLNMRQKETTSELLQAKGGLRAYVSSHPSWGLWFFKMSAAYQYQKGFDVGQIKNAAIVGQPAGFTVTSLNQAQNSFIPGFELFVKANNGIFASASYDGEFAGAYMSNSISGRLGIFF